MTYDQKIALIYNGQEVLTESKVFLDTGQPDVFNEEVCILKISPYIITPKNRSIGLVTMCFEVYYHYKINTMNNYTTRIDVITQRILKLFNGADIGGLGLLFFDGFREPLDKVLVSGQLPFKGRVIYLSTNVGVR